MCCVIPGNGNREIRVFEYTEPLSTRIAIHDLPTGLGLFIQCNVGKIYPLEEAPTKRKIHWRLEFIGISEIPGTSDSSTSKS
jgi:hypothetical protein